MIDLSKRMQQDLRDGLMTAPRPHIPSPSSRWARENRRPMSSLGAGAGIILVLLLLSCGVASRISAVRSQSPTDLAKQLIPAGSVIAADPEWVIGTWSARKSYTFESQFNWLEYRSWATRKLGAGWQCHADAGGDTLACSRLLPTEQQVLSISVDIGSTKDIRVRLTFTAIPT
jgi:hypothetical protein